MNKVITYGTFDLLHRGHINLLRRAKALGDHLTVAVSTDEFNRLKGKEAFQCYDDRATLVGAVRYVDEVIPESSWDQKVHDIKEYAITTFVIGDDWQGKFDFLKQYCAVCYLARTPGISTTEVRAKFALHAADPMESVSTD